MTSATTPPFGSHRIKLNSRTLGIGSQTYQLQNIARVQIVRLPEPPEAGRGRAGLAVAAGVGSWVLLLILGFILMMSLGGESNTGAYNAIGTVVAVALFPCLALGVFVYIKTKRPYIPLYALELETTGAPVAALVSPDYGELDRISGVIVNAIENPPQSEVVSQINNVAYGDQIDLRGAQGVQVGHYGTQTNRWN